MTTNGALQLGVLRDEWGFDGVVVSDWMAAHDTAGTANGGLDIVMPARGSPWGDGSSPRCATGTVAARGHRRARHAGCCGSPPGSARWPVPPRPCRRRAGRSAIDGAALAREIAARSFVLASNRDGVLPLDRAELGSVALIGALAKNARVLGGGSATVFPAHVISPLEGLSAALPAGVTLSYAVGADPRAHLAPAAAPAWTGLRAVVQGRVQAPRCTQTPLATGAGRWMELPAGVERRRPGERRDLRPADRRGRAASIASSIRGTGRFTLTADGSVAVRRRGAGRTPTDFSRLFLAPPEHRLPLPLEAGATADVTLVRHLSAWRGRRPGVDVARLRRADRHRRRAARRGRAGRGGE